MEAETVDTICRALGGLPAALEAAAGLAGAVSEAEIVRISRDEPLSLGLRGRPLTEIAAATWRELPEEAQDYLLANVGWPGSFDADGRTIHGGHDGRGGGSGAPGPTRAAAGSGRGGAASLPNRRFAACLDGARRRDPSPEQEDRRARYQMEWTERALDEGSPRR